MNRASHNLRRSCSPPIKPAILLEQQHRRTYPDIVQRMITNSDKQNSLYVVEAYSDPAFRNEPESQRVFTARMKIIGKRLMIVWLSMVAVFSLMLVVGFFVTPLIIPGGIVLMGILVLAAGILLIPRPKLACPICHEPMKLEYAPVANDRHGLFLICPRCRVYVYTHRTQR
jgi:hypothetical protein